MSDIITEALLEMHFHHALVEHFKTTYGANFLRLLKPSQRQEAWVGFDQGWVSTSMTTQEFFDHLRQAIQSEVTSIKTFYLGYFLQFKTVQCISRRSKHFPRGYSIPYLRSELSLEPNKDTGLSQHETLLRLSRINLACVSYACSMLFNLDDLYQEPNLDYLLCVELTTAPTGWATNERHFITFKSENDLSPLWCSHPVEGRALSFKEWASPNSKVGPKKLTAKEIVSLIEAAYKELSGRPVKREPPLLKYQMKISTRILPECLIIMEFVEKTAPSDKPRRMIRLD